MTILGTPLMCVFFWMACGAGLGAIAAALWALFDKGPARRVQELDELQARLAVTQHKLVRIQAECEVRLECQRLHQPTTTLARYCIGVINGEYR